MVHGTEGDLTLLEQNWEKVQHQTLWSLQDCFMSPSVGHDVHSALPDDQVPSRQESTTKHGRTMHGTPALANVPTLQPNHKSVHTSLANAPHSALSDKQQPPTTSKSSTQTLSLTPARSAQSILANADTISPANFTLEELDLL